MSDASELDAQNAHQLMSATVAGMVTVPIAAPANAASSIVVTPDGMSYLAMYF